MYKEKGSKFLAFAFPVNDEVEIQAHLAALRKEYYDARHHCYAWILELDKKRFRANDDGEPNHSAGDPILGQIRSKNITNVLVVVVRYFGGIKLGVGGLITAYKAAAEDALLHARIIEVQVKDKLVLRFPYETTSEVMRVVKEFDLIILRQEFDNACLLEIEVGVLKTPLLLERLDLLKKMGSSLSFEIMKSPD